MITNQAVNQAIDYILLHIEDDLSLEIVAEHCHFSKYIPKFYMRACDYN